MQLTYKHIVLALFIIAIIYLITLGSNVEGLENENPEQIVDKITFNADKFLQNLTEDDAKQMLVSNQLMPWVKFMEEAEANELYEKLFNNESNENMMLKDLISTILDDELSSYLPSNPNDLVGLYNKVQNKLKEKTNNEINEYGEQFGFMKTANSLSLPSNSDLIDNVNKFLSDNKNKFKNDLLVSHSGSDAKIPSKNDTKADAQKLIDLGIDVNNINLQSFPNVLKYRVRNNRDYVANSIANIINSIAFKKGLEWKKVNVNGKIISDTTVNPNNVLLMKKSKIIRLKNIELDSINRPLNLLPSDFSDAKKQHIYDILLNLDNKEYNSEDTVLNTNFTNSLGQIVWSEPAANATNEDKAAYQNKIINVLEHLKPENAFVLNPSNFIRKSQFEEVDEMGLPLFMHDPYPEPVNLARKIFRSGDTKGELQNNESIIIQEGDSQVAILKKMNGLYYVNNNGEWVNKSFTNQFTWNVQDLENIGKNLSGNEDKSELRFDVIALNIVLGEIGKQSSKDLYYHTNNSELPLPIKYVDPYPLKWEGISQRNYALNQSLEPGVNPEVVEFKRMKINGAELVESNNNGALQDDEVIVGRNENILVKIVYEDDVRKYVDVNSIEYTNVDISERTGKIGWKVNFLKDMFENTNSDVIKKELTILNLLILAKGKSENARKNKLLPTGPRNKVSLVIKNPPQNANDKLLDSDKTRVIESIAQGLSDYNLVASGSSKDISTSQVKEMNRLNLASLVENGIQRVERLLISKKALSRSKYPDGPVLQDAEFNDIKFIYMSDILRLQKAIFGGFNNYIEPEDGIPDLIYASFRFKLILESKQDESGQFLLNRASPQDRLEIENVINGINSIDYENINLDDKSSVQEGIINLGVTNEKLVKVYEYMNIDEYFSVKLDLGKDVDLFEDVHKKIDENKRTIRNELCEMKKQAYFNSNLEGIVRNQCGDNCDDKEVYDKVCDLKVNYKCDVLDEEILEKYNYVNATNGVNEVKARLFSMTNEKKVQILNAIKDNIEARQNANDTNLINDIRETVNLTTTFKDLKMLHFAANKVIQSQEEQVVEGFYNNFNIIGGYSKDNNYTRFY